MSHRVIGKVLACMLAVLLPAATMSAETHAAMLYTTNTVMLNGVGAERSSAVFVGDRIQTPANTSVRLTSEGSTVLVGPSSTLVYQGDALRLRSGSTMVTTEKGMETLVQRLSITPAAPGRSSYRVVRGGGQVMVAALRGPVNISDGSGSKTVAEGNTTSVPDPEPATPQGGATPGVSGGGGLGKISGRTAAIVAAGIAAGVILLVYETTGSSKAPLTPK